MKEITIFKHFTQVIGNRTLPEIVKAIQSGVYSHAVLAVRRAVERGDKKVADELKKSLHAFTVSGKFEGGRTMERLKEYHPYMILDIDKLKKEELERVNKMIRELPYTHVAFLSPSGKGCKIIVKVDANQSQHLLAYLQVAEFYEKKLHIKIDRSGKDITRLCFFSFDEDIFYKEDSKVFEVKETVVKGLPFLEVEQIKRPSNVFPLRKESKARVSNNSINTCLEFTKKKMEYSNGNRNNFVYLFASNCNREGISESEVLSYALQSFDLEEKEIKQTIQSAFHHHQSEFNSKELHLLKQKKESQKDRNSIVEEMLETPCFPDEIFPKLPSLLKRGCKVLETKRERDIFLTGALLILSGCLKQVEGRYDRTPNYPNLYGFIIAPAANGKGALKYAKILGNAIDKKYFKEYEAEKHSHEEAMEIYNMEVSDFRRKKTDSLPQRPKPLNRKTLFLPGNSSAAMVIRQLHHSDGCGIICETEADTLSQAIKQDWGGFSDLLRKAFHFEGISYGRKSEDELFNIESPRLSIALSGTPDQVFGLIPNSEDGLFSRFLFYVFSTDIEWRDVSEDESEFDLISFYQGLSLEVLEMVDWLKEHPIQFKLTATQWQELNGFFKKLLKKVYLFKDAEASSVVKRSGVILHRIVMILSAIRKFETKDTASIVCCSEIDFKIGIQLIKVFWAHGLFMFEHLPKQKRKLFKKMKNHKQQFFDGLPQEFSRQEALDLGATFNLSRATVDRLLKKYKEGYVRQVGHGVFSKL